MPVGYLWVSRGLRRVVNPVSPGDSRKISRNAARQTCLNARKGTGMLSLHQLSDELNRDRLACAERRRPARRLGSYRRTERRASRVMRRVITTSRAIMGLGARAGS
jgi:hypothetical protein